MLKKIILKIRRLKSIIFPVRLKNYQKYQKIFKQKNGLEVGGPSPIFSSSGLIPLYPVIPHLDGCNFNSKTVWEGKIKEGNYYNYYQKRKGYQYICEASKLDKIESNKYDFVISSNTLEHLANPLLAIKEWLRVIKPKGYLLLIPPNKKYTFDHRRKVTKFSHLLADFKRGVDEKDLTHLEEILKLHDLLMDPGAGTRKNFKKRSKQNYQNRCLHQHVFNEKTLGKIFHYFSLEIIDLQTRKEDMVILGRKIN